MDVQRMRKRNQCGVSLLETMVAVSLGMVLMASLFSLYYGAAKGAANQDTRVSAERAGRLVADHMARDLRLAGLIALADANGDSNDIRRDVPYQTWSDSIRQDFEYANTYEVVFTGAVDNDTTTETVRYYLDHGTRTLKQEIWKWSRDSLRWRAPVFRNIASNVDFIMFKYYDRNGTTIPNPVTYPAGGYTMTAGERVRVTEVEVTVVTRATKVENHAATFLYMADGTYWHDKYVRNVQRFAARSRNLSLGA